MRAGGLFGNAQKGAAAAEQSDGKKLRSPDQAKVMPEAPTRALSRDAVFFFCGGAFCFLRRGFDFPVFRCKLYGPF